MQRSVTANIDQQIFYKNTKQNQNQTRMMMKLNNRTLTFAAAVVLLCCTVAHGQYGEPCGGKVSQVIYELCPICGSCENGPGNWAPGSANRQRCTNCQTANWAKITIHDPNSPANLEKKREERDKRNKKSTEEWWKQRGVRDEGEENMFDNNFDEQEQQTVDGVPVASYRRVDAKCLLKYAKYSLNWAECISNGYRTLSRYGHLIGSPRHKFP